MPQDSTTDTTAPSNPLAPPTQSKIDHLQEFVFRLRYARRKANGLRESFAEGISRVLDMHRAFYAARGVDMAQLEPLLSQVHESLSSGHLLGSQRALQFGGDPILKKNVRIYNCSASYADRPRFFAELFWVLLNGTGTGYSVQRHHVDQLPAVVAPSLYKPTKVIKIEDTIEGWADAVHALVLSYMPAHGKPSRPVVFDYRAIRPKGSPLSSSSGRAPGPEPLARALERVRSVLDGASMRANNKLKPIEAHDICCHLAGAVLAGGVRRSAMIALFSYDDAEMLSCKTGDSWKYAPWRSAANNSAVIPRRDIVLKKATKKSPAQIVKGATPELIDSVVKHAKDYGDPGILFVDDLDELTNPCGEIGLYGRYIDDKGKKYTGWQFCNLCEIAAHRVAHDESLFLATCRAAAILGTLQAGYTDMGYLDRDDDNKPTQSITEREALLGVSMTGIMDAIQHLTPERLRSGVEVIRETNAQVAKMLGINPAARLTCVKPAGHTSILLGAAGNGVNPPLSTRFVRRVEDNLTDPVVQAWVKANPNHVETDPENETGKGKDACWLLFPVEVNPDVPTVETMSVEQRIDVLRTVRSAWVEAGKNADLCVLPSSSHNTSCTIELKIDEWDRFSALAYEHHCDLSGLAFMGFYDVGAAKKRGLAHAHLPIEPMDADDPKWQAMQNVCAPDYDHDDHRAEYDERAMRLDAACVGGVCHI